ncbi:HEAT repeat protein [Natrinema hispanicum]|uniref:HEAT repeat protein n=1 Tax=Natrinema hispanicum TaxID=392421 RepID=A0A482YL13_9EURY|nr:HEAT repeat domain-containing protein [Natrinema hispanicum]RZV12562.1 HEAT repeat protein [Natrinema hispanicum]
MIVLAFDRDWTVDVNPHPNREAVSLDWVRHWAHKTNHEVWAIGNQDLVYEAGIPGTVEAIRRYHGDLDVLGDQDDAGRYEWWPSRERRLELLAELFPSATRYIVVDDLDLGHIDGWDHYTAWEFCKALEKIPLNGYLSLSSNEADDSNGIDSEHAKEIYRKLHTANEVEVVIDVCGGYRFRSREWKKVRPSTLPIGAPPTIDFTLASGKTRRVQLQMVIDVTVIEEIPDREDGDDSEDTTNVEPPGTGLMLGRADQADCLTTPQRVEFAIDVLKVATQLDALPIKLMEMFTDAVKEVSDDDTAPVVQASEYTAEYPSLLRQHVDELCTLAGVSDTEVSRQAVWCLMELAEDDPQAVFDAVPTLSIALERDDVETRSYATYALASISKPYPEELLPAFDTLLELAEDENQAIQTNALSTVGHIVSGYPDAAVEFVDSIAALLESDKKRIRNNAAGLLGDIAQEHPEVVIEYADELAARFDDPNIQARINASIALLRAEEADPSAIRAQSDWLEQALDDTSPEVRANACALIANSEVPASIEKLRELRKADLNETVKERASWAIQRLS